MRTLLTGVQTEMPLGLSVPRTPQQKHVLAGGGKLGQLVEGVDLAASCNNPLTGSSGELKGGDSESLGDVEESDIVGDCADDGDDPGVVLGLLVGDGSAVLPEVPDDPGDGDGVAVESRLVEALVDDLVELGVGPAGEEGVELRHRRLTLIRLLR